ncbi:von Willebrand factor A domain-containing protein 7-like isoform X2 [Melanotaenia boesemani]|uniref:von Willebrand factor A domain-containing protein 7-like isoform X2 n=1 Tax=Melanotaenia boesemani TaxID=1250792 RepID=UPI001C042C23|nr:von Willebrand factor A domain-containing protein 7-like isoform X2 [Melanotaenia boesemani]
MAARQAVLFLVIIICLVDFTSSFRPIFSQNSITHFNITLTAILRKTAEVCRDLAASEGRNFSLNIDNSLSAETVQKACFSQDSSTSPISFSNFQASIFSIIFSNAVVDLDFDQSAAHHFHNEAFQEGRDIITQFVAAVKNCTNEKNYVCGRQNLGQALHTLQDFYSHSNWVELENNVPYSALIKPEQPLTSLTGPSTPTCRNCTGENCTDNLLPDVLLQRLLTSGYFSSYSSAKPRDKCSHGGPFDRTSKEDPVGGISKDENGSSHGFHHAKAAALALNASMELLEDIRSHVGNAKTFLRLMGLGPQGNVLCLVIDTTGSMSDDIFEAQLVTKDIIDSRRGTQQEPSAYILVPFNDPGFGPVTSTTDPDIFKARLSELTANGGGDNPEMAFSGLLLALVAAPPSSEIFVFTDAPPKDSQLKNTISALIESKKSTVTFLLTGFSSGRRRRHVFPRSLTQTDVQLYQELAEASGGQAIVVPKFDLYKVIDVVKDSSTSAVVTVFQVVRDNPDTFTFTVDSSLKKMTAYITGNSSLTFSVTSSTGVSQSSSQSSGPLGSFTIGGNFNRLDLNTENQAGLWKINVTSNGRYSVRVTGQSSLNFMYERVERQIGIHGDFFPVNGRPLIGSNASFLIFVTGSDLTRVTEVTLIDNSGSIKVNGSSQSLGNNIHLATFTGIPEGKFVLLLKGENSSSLTRSAPSSFQRQGATQIETSNIIVTIKPDFTITEPGSNVTIPFTVSINANGTVNDSASGTFTIQANNAMNDRIYDSTSPKTVTIEAGSRGTANGTVTVAVPASTALGTDITLTIQAKNEASADINFSVRSFSVASRVTTTTTTPAPTTTTTTTPASTTTTTTTPASTTTTTTTPVPTATTTTTPVPTATTTTTPVPTATTTTTPVPTATTTTTPVPTATTTTTPVPTATTTTTPVPTATTTTTPVPTATTTTTPAPTTTTTVTPTSAAMTIHYFSAYYRHYFTSCRLPIVLSFSAIFLSTL